MVSVVGNSVANVLRAVMQEIGPYQAISLTSTGATGIQVISTTVIDSEAPAARHGGKYLYSHGPGIIREQQRVTRTGFVGATGTFTVAASFSALPPSGTTMSLLGTIPWIDQDGLIGALTCLNRMARKLWIRYRYPIVSTGGDVVTYDLGSLWWATRERFIRLLEPDYSSTGQNAPASVDWNIVQNADIWTLEMGAGYATGETFYLDVEMPLAARIYIAQTAAWAMSTSPAGAVSADGDAFLGTWNTVLQCTLYEVMKQLSVQAGGNRKAYWTDRLNEQRNIVSAIKLYALDDDGESLGEGPNQAASSGVGSVGDKGLFSGGRGY
jgi:hypothetical protein